MADVPEWIRKAAMAQVLEDLIMDPEAYLTGQFGLQPRKQHVRDLADLLYDIAIKTE